MRLAVQAMRAWGRRRWLVAAGATVAATLVVALPTDLIDTPIFSREVPPTWWSWPALLVSALLTGLLVATYVRDEPAAGLPDVEEQADPAAPSADERTGRAWGGAGGVLTFFAVGCPVCNKLVLLTLGTSGALTWFQPVQPVLSVLAVLLLAGALRQRLIGQVHCPVLTPGLR